MPSRRPFTVALAVSCVVLVSVVALVPFVASVREAVSPGTIPQLAPPPGAPPVPAGVLVTVSVVRALFIAVPMVLAVLAWRGRGRVGLLAALLAVALVDLARGAAAGPVTVPVAVLGALLLITPSARAWARPGG